MTAKKNQTEQVSKLEAYFRWKKETPGTHSYQQVDPKTGQDERTPVGTLYIKKDALPDGVPNAIKMTLEFTLKGGQ